jgi:hypothetical protein
MIVRRVMLGRFAMMTGRVLVMISGLGVMFCCLLGHGFSFILHRSGQVRAKTVFTRVH